MNKRKIRIAVVRREPVDLDRLALALLALVEQILSEEDDTGNDAGDPDVGEASS